MQAVCLVLIDLGNQAWLLSGVHLSSRPTDCRQAASASLADAEVV